MNKPILHSLFAFSLIALLGIESSAQDSPIVIKNANVQLIQNAEIPAREAGILRKIHFKEGRIVKAGEVIASLDDELHILENRAALKDYEVAVLESKNEADMKYAKKSMEVSAKVYTRSQNAVREFPKSISKTDLERAKLENERDKLALEQSENRMQVAEKQAELKKAQFEVTEQRLVYRKIKAPFDGMVVQTFAQESEFVQVGQPVLRLINLQTLRVQVNLSAAMYLPGDVQGRKVSLDVKMPSGKNEKFEGEVTFANPEVLPTGKFIVWAEVKNRNNLLRPGVRGTLTIDGKATESKEAK